MNDDRIRESISRAQAIARDADDPFQVVAFRVVLERLLAEGAVPGQPAEKIGGVPMPSTVSEFLATAAPRSHVDTVVQMAYYLWRSGDTAGVTIEELLGAYAQARLKKPKNVSDVLATAIRKGYLVEAAQKKDGKKCWLITQTGEAFVEAGRR